MVALEVSLRCLFFSILALLIGVCLPVASSLADERTAVVEPKQAVRRVALVIGNGAYVHVGHLVNPSIDAAAMAKLFTDAGFEAVEAKTDLGITAFNRALADFEVSARGADVAIVYYSGHGIEYAGRNYLIPVDAAMQREVDVKYEAVPLDHVLDTVAGATRLKLVILDACRTDPFQATSHTKAVNRGLARPETTEVNELVAYSARAGTAAADGDPGADSPYTAALLKRLTTPGLDVELALRRVRDDVLTATHREQEPFYYGSMGGDELPLVAKQAAVAPTPQPTMTPGTEGPVKDEKVARLEAAPDRAVGECDRLASSPLDVTRPAGIGGIAPDKIDAARAVPACRAALAARPADPRILFQLARALGKAGGAETAELYRKAADAGHLGAMSNLGAVYANGAGVAKDEAEAVRWYRRAADGGFTLAVDNLAKMYAEGLGVTKDPAEAVRLYRKSADAGDLVGVNGLGVMYEKGEGVTKDAAEAMRWYRKAADGGLTVAMNNLGFMYANGSGATKDPGEAVRWYRTAADAGDLLGMNRLGYMYENGAGVPKDAAEAARWYRKAADGGLPVAMNNLGLLYANGTGVTKDLGEAVRWYRTAADAGDAKGMTNLGIMYANGLGVAKDAAEALRWYRKGADAGAALAMSSLGFLYETGAGVPKDATEAVRWYRKAAESGDAYGMNNLGSMYERGNGVPKDTAEAVRWYRMAADAGNQTAKDNLTRLARR